MTRWAGHRPCGKQFVQFPGNVGTEKVSQPSQCVLDYSNSFPDCGMLTQKELQFLPHPLDKAFRVSNVVGPDGNGLGIRSVPF